VTACDRERVQMIVRPLLVCTRRHIWRGCRFCPAAKEARNLHPGRPERRFRQSGRRLHGCDGCHAKAQLAGGGRQQHAFDKLLRRTAGRRQLKSSMRVVICIQTSGMLRVASLARSTATKSTQRNMDRVVGHCSLNLLRLRPLASALRVTSPWDRIRE
jgi:hypothetical protein